MENCIRGKMNVPFHTPSFGDEVFAVTDIESNVNACFDQHHYQQQSKRMHNSMDQSMDDYHSLNDDSFGGLNNSSSTMLTSPTPTPQVTVASRKQLPTTTDPNEPAKPLSAYALFFRDTVSAIKQQNPNCSFQEISRIVSSMWEALDPAHKNVYNKKNEMAKNDYIKQMRVYRLQQSEQQQQQQQQQHQQLMEQQQLIDQQNHLQQQQLAHLSAAVSPMQSKPAVFTIARSSSDIDVQAFNNSTNSLNIANHITNSPQHSLGMQQYHAQQQFDLQQPIEQQQHQLQSATNNYHQQHQQQQQQQQQLQHISEPQELSNTNHNDRESANCNDFNPPPAQQIQLLTEAGSVQKCIRENCNKRAIINPDWEDEYCSNECVVIHCRNVFNSWVQANLEGRSQ